MISRQHPFFVMFILILVTASGCIQPQTTIHREDTIPSSAVKYTPADDLFPPVLHDSSWEDPVPVPGDINTAGAEDSPFIPCCDDTTLYFFFTPDVRVPVEKQVLDGVTGIYVSHKTDDDTWGSVQRVLLQDADKLALDGCTFVLNNTIWFCSAREGYTGLHWFTATYDQGSWGSWTLNEFDPAFDVGELHIATNGTTLYYHSDRAGGKGKHDIWRITYENGEWRNPTNIEPVNTAEDESLPFLSADGSALWFTRWYQGSPAIFRSLCVNNIWQEPQMILSQFAGEPTVDSQGNIYFVHHYYDGNGTMLEADLYVAYKKK